MVVLVLYCGLLTLEYSCNLPKKTQKRTIIQTTILTGTMLMRSRCESFNILMIKGTQNLNALKFYHKYSHGNLLPYLYIYNIETQGAHHSRDKRHRCQLRTNFTKTNYADNTPRHHLPILVHDTLLYMHNWSQPIISTDYCPTITMTSWWAQWRLKSPVSRLFT